MTFEIEHLFFAGLVYLLLLFLIAYATEQEWIPRWIARHPLTYALSLGVYATSWSFYGSVGFAERQGFNFLSIYLGVTLAFALMPILLAPILRLCREYQLTSLADVFAFRFRSQAAGVLVTVFMLCGTFPYIALQILAVTQSMQILTEEAPPDVIALGFCATLILFAVLFGARHITPREKHEGLVVAIAFESLVKLFALCAVGVFAVYGVFGGFGGMEAWLTSRPEAMEALYAPVSQGPWTTLTFLAFCAAFLLPRQFHMTFTENVEARSLFTAAWAFPAFLLLLNLFIPAILWAGIELRAGDNPDYYVLGITLEGRSRVLTTLAFIGGVSAASAMMIVTTLALSSMCLNHLLLPARRPRPGANIYRWLLWGRRTLIAIIVLAGYGFYFALQRNEGLVQIGLISFVAVSQFLPGVFGLLYWPRATRAGFMAGLIGGAVVWTFTLLVPLLQRSGILSLDVDFVTMLGGSGYDPWAFSTFTSLAVNWLLFFWVSLATEPSQEERDAAESCRMTTQSLPRGVVLGARSPTEFKERLTRILGPEGADHEVRQAVADLEMDPEESEPSELRRLRERIERNLSGLLGPLFARMIVDERLQMDPGAQLALADNIRFIEERLERSQTRLQGLGAELDALRRYHQQIIHDLPIGACSLGSDHKVVSWNLAMQKMSGVAHHNARGVRAGRLPAPWNRLFGDILADQGNHRHKVQARIDGRNRWFNLHKASFEDPSHPGRSGGEVILVEDLSDVQTLERELAHSERLASIGRLAAGVAHEIGNPVTGIACLAQNLRTETGDADARETSDRIVEQTKRIGDIVQSLVRFSHGGSVSEDDFRPVRLQQCIEEATRLVGLGHEGKTVECRNLCPRELETLGDRPRLVQVFVNLLTNACDASRSGSVVEVSAAVQGKSVVVEVADRGEGIPADLIDQVFEPFVTTKPPGQGTGLGLSLVYRIVQDHGGAISIESEPGSGTRVRLRLPAAAGAARPPQDRAVSS